MPPQLHQAANTYLTRRSLWVVAAVVVLSCTISLIAAPEVFDTPAAAVPFVGIAAAMTGYVLAIHAKWQFCNPRARLLPAFNRPHLAMLAAILIVFCVIYPLAAAQAARWNALGALACSIAGTAAGIWSIYRPHPLLIATAFGVFLSFGLPLGTSFYARSDATPTVATAQLAVLAIGWGSIALWLHRLTVVREEDVEYFVPTLGREGTRGRLAAGQAFCASGRTPAFDSWLNRALDWLAQPRECVPATTVAARRRLLRDGLLARPLAVRAASMAAIAVGVLTIAAFVGMNFGAGDGLDQRHNTPVIGVMIFMTAAMGNGQLAARRARMGRELLLPLGRQEYFRALFASSAQNALMIWIATQAAIVVYVATFMPGYFFPGFLAVATALSLGFHGCMFGIQTSVAQKSSSLVHVAFLFILIFPASAPVFLAVKHLPRPVAPRPAATAAEREQAVQEQYAETYGNVARHLPPGKPMSPELKQEVLKLAAQIVSPRLGEPWVNPYIPWACAALLTAVGVAAFLHARRRWLTLELG